MILFISPYLGYPLLDESHLMNLIMTVILTVVCFYLGYRYLLSTDNVLKTYRLYDKYENYGRKEIRIIGWFAIFVGIFAILLCAFETGFLKFQ